MDSKTTSETAQVSIEVNNCILPHLPYQQYALQAKLGQFHPTDSRMTASTAWKAPQSNIIHFATKLYIKTRKDALQAHPTCSIAILAADRQGKTEIASGEANPLKEEEQTIQLHINKDQSELIEIRLQFKIMGCENRWNNTKLHELRGKRHPFLSPQQKKGLQSNPEASTANDSKALASFKTQDKCSKPNNLIKPKPYIPPIKHHAIHTQQSLRKCKRLRSFQSDGLASCRSKKIQDPNNVNKCCSPQVKKPQIPRVPLDKRSPRAMKSPYTNAKPSVQNSRQNKEQSDASSVGSLTLQLDLLVEPNSLPIYSRSRQ